MRFSVYFGSILNEKWLFSHRNNNNNNNNKYSIYIAQNIKYVLVRFRVNNDISCTHVRGHASQIENLEKMCNLVRLGVYFDHILHNFFLSDLFV